MSAVTKVLMDDMERGRRKGMGSRRGRRHSEVHGSLARSARVRLCFVDR